MLPLLDIQETLSLPSLLQNNLPSKASHAKLST